MKILERETRLEFTLYLFENIKRLCDPVRFMYRFLYRFRRFGNFRVLQDISAGQESNLIPLRCRVMCPRERSGNPNAASS
jgi:hypothetical protein